MSSPKFEVTIGVKVPGRKQFSIANAEVKMYGNEDDSYDDILDQAVRNLREAICAAQVVVDESSSGENR